MGKNRMNNGLLRACLAVCALGAATPVVIGQANNPQGTQGWIYGGENCGCVADINATQLDCLNCCNAWFNYPFPPEGLAVTPGDLAGCHAFCNQASFPCIQVPRCKWWSLWLYCP